MHKGLKNLIIIIGLTIFTLWLSGLNVTTKSVTYLNQKKWITVYHQQFLWLFIAMITSTAIISFLKHLSIHSCPWSLTEFGGTEPWVPLFGQLPKGAVAGHCFPGGHASGGFALMAIYFAFKDELIKVAKFGLVLGLVLGFIMGWGQMIRGAHFMSHNLWSAWIVWALLLTQYMMWQPKITTQSN